MLALGFGFVFCCFCRFPFLLGGFSSGVGFGDGGDVVDDIAALCCSRVGGEKRKETRDWLAMVMRREDLRWGWREQLVVVVMVRARRRRVRMMDCEVVVLVNGRN